MAHPDDRLECKFPRPFLICLQKGKAALPDGKTAYLARLCMSIDLVSEAVFVKRKCLSNDSELKVEVEASGLMATLGPLGPGVVQVFYGAPKNGAEKIRLIRQPSVSSQTKCSHLG